MVTRAETRVVYAAGAAQGIVLVTFPAASTIFTSPHEYDLSDTQYGFLFLPQVAAAITASLLGGWLGSRFATKRVYLAGLAAGLVSMLLLIVGQFFETDTSVAFSLLLVATAFLGVLRPYRSRLEHPHGGVSSLGRRLLGVGGGRTTPRDGRA